MRYLIAILVMMTVLLASISCSQAEEGTIPGNGDLQPITQPKPSQRPPSRKQRPPEGNQRPPSRKRRPPGGKPASTEPEAASTQPEPAPETRGEKTPGEEGYREANPETSGETGTVIPPSEVGAETKGSRGDPRATLAPDMDVVAASGRSPKSPDWHKERVQMQLKAGEVDDNQRWQEYLDFVEEYRGPPVHATNLSNRQIITVLDRQGNPVPNAQVNISRRSDGTGATLTKRTYADGRTMFFPLEGLDPGDGDEKR